MLTSGGSPTWTALPASVSPLEESSSRHPEALSDYLRHSPLLRWGNLGPGDSLARIIEIIIS